MKRIYLLFCCVSLTTIIALGQNDFKRNDIYLEAAGNGLFGSVNYERQLTKEAGLGCRIGLGFYTENGFYATIPVGINYLFELKRKGTFIDAGMGIAWTQKDRLFNSKNEENFSNFIPTIGYRVHTAKNVMWRLSAAPIINKYSFFPWLGISIGKRF